MRKECQAGKILDNSLLDLEPVIVADSGRFLLRFFNVAMMNLFLQAISNVR